MQPHQATCARKCTAAAPTAAAAACNPGPSPALCPCHRLSSRNQLPAHSLRAAECIQCRVPQGAPWLWRTSGLQQQRHIRRASWTTYVDANAFDHVPWSRAWKRAWLMRVSLAGGRSRQHGVWTWSGGGEGSGGDMPQLRCGGASLVRADRPFPKHTRAGAAALGLSTGSAQGATTRGGLGPPSHDNWQHKRI